MSFLFGEVSVFWVTGNGRLGGLWPGFYGPPQKRVDGKQMHYGPRQAVAPFFVLFKAALSTSWNIGLEYRRE